jgi:hypothetical protein
MAELNNSILPAFAAEIGLITYRSVTGGGAKVGAFPLPSNYLAAAVLFGVLALPQGDAKRPATLAAWAFVTATYFQLMDKLPGSAAKLFSGTAGTPDQGDNSATVPAGQGTGSGGTGQPGRYKVS